jgi:hypothetical protein
VSGTITARRRDRGRDQPCRPPARRRAGWRPERGPL